MAGLYFDEFYEGQKFVHDITRTVTETDNLLFTVLTHNPQPLHLDIEFCKANGSLAGGILVNSIFTFGLMLGVSVTDTTLGTTVANLGMDDVKFPAPVHIGDTLRSETTVIEKRDSKSRPDAGIVVFEHKSFNQKGILVAHCKRSALMKRRPA